MAKKLPTTITSLRYDFLQALGTGFDVNSLIGKGASAEYEALVESSVAHVMDGLDPVKALELATVQDWVVAFYAALPPGGRVYISQAFARQLKKALGGKLEDNSPAAGLLEAIDQLHPGMVHLLDEAKLDPADFRDAIKAKTTGTFTDIITSFKEHLMSNHHDPPPPGDHGPTHHAVVATTPAPSPKVDARRLIYATWDPSTYALFTALEKSARAEYRGTTLAEEDRQWGDQADEFIDGLNSLLDDPLTRNKLEADFMELYQSGCRVDDMQFGPNGPASWLVDNIINVGDAGRHHLISAQADAAIHRYLPINQVRDALHGFTGKKPPVIATHEVDADGKPIDQRNRLEKFSDWAQSSGETAGKIVIRAIKTYVASVITICTVAAIDTFQTEQLDGWVATLQNVILGLAICGLFSGWVVLIIARLGVSAFDLPLKAVLSGLKGLGADLSIEDAPIFKQANLITIVASGLGVLFTVIAVFCAVGGGSVLLPLFAILGVLSLGAWGELQKRFFQAKWSGQTAHADPHHAAGHTDSAGEERKLQKAEANYLFGLKVFNALMAAFFGALIISGIGTAVYRYQATVAREAKVVADKLQQDSEAAACTQVKATLSTLANQWNKKHDSPDSGDALLCFAAADMATDSPSAAHINSLCQQEKLCP